MKEIAVEKVNFAKTKLLTDLVSFIRGMVIKAYKILYPSKSRHFLRNLDYIVYNVLHLSELKRLMNVNDDGLIEYGQQSK